MPQTQVDIAYVPDYLEFVAPENEMWLHHISTKMRALAYSTIDQFLADFRLMVTNCEAYNSPGNGKFGGPGEPASSSARCVHLCPCSCTTGLLLHCWAFDRSAIAHGSTLT